VLDEAISIRPLAGNNTAGKGELIATRETGPHNSGPRGKKRHGVLGLISSSVRARNYEMARPGIWFRGANAKRSAAQ
jgi:hypothetical protein